MNKANLLNILSILLLSTSIQCQEHQDEPLNTENELKMETDYQDESNAWQYNSDTLEKKTYTFSDDQFYPRPIPDEIRKRLFEQRPDLFHPDASPLPEEWIVESSFDQAPPLLKGIVSYLQSQSHSIRYYNPLFIPSCQRFILVGPPGSGKTTLAHAIASKLECPAILIPASTLLGHFRNETANNICKCLSQYISTPNNIVIIIDELHKLFEHHESDRADDSQSAAAFWLAIDQMEKYCSRAILICTANDVSTLPPEIKSRFAGKVIEMRVPEKKDKIKTFKQSICHDPYTCLDRSIDNRFIANMIDQLSDGSLRDIRLLIDTAKMFFYQENPLYDQDGENFPMVLTKKHFQNALNQIKAESSLLAGNVSQQLLKKLEKWGLVFGIASNICIVSRTLYELYHGQ